MVAVFGVRLAGSYFDFARFSFQVPIKGSFFAAQSDLAVTEVPINRRVVTHRAHFRWM